MKQTLEGYVRKCSHAMLPSGTMDTFIEVEVVLIDSHTFEKMICKLSCKDPNWTSNEDSLLTYRDITLPISEKAKYTLFKTVHDANGKERCLTDVEYEMLFDLIFACCGEEITYYRQKQEEKMMKLFGMSTEEYVVLSDSEIKELEQPCICKK